MYEQLCFDLDLPEPPNASGRHADKPDPAESPENAPEPEATDATTSRSENPNDADEKAKANSADTTSRYKRRAAMRQAVLRWLEDTKGVSGAAINVPTRISRFRADLAAFWSRPVQNVHSEGPQRVLEPVRTSIIQCCLEREDCWPDCARSSELLPLLRDLKERIWETERQIRGEEPELRETNTLFEEYAEWRYEDTGNREYHHLKREIEKTEHALYHGTQFDRIRRAHLADWLFLAVPEGLVAPSELTDGWGLLWVMADLSVQEVVSPQDRECLPANRIHLVQNIAVAAREAVMFTQGIRRINDRIVFVHPPRGHRKPQQGKFPE